MSHHIGITYIFHDYHSPYIIQVIRLDIIQSPSKWWVLQVACSRVLVASGRGGESTQPRTHYLAGDYNTLY